MKKSIKIVALLMILSALFVSCTTDEVKPQDPKVAPKAEYYFVGDELPAITAEGTTKGTIVWDTGQTTAKGVKKYKWTFTPEDKKLFNILTGEMELKQVDKIFENETFTEKQKFEAAESLVYKYCTFKQGIEARGEVDLAIIGGEIHAGPSGSEKKCVYMTAPKYLLLDKVIFTGETEGGHQSTGGYALDLNLYNKEGQEGNTDSIIVRNCTFTNNNIAISLKVRHGENDKHNDLTDLKTGRGITNPVEITGNTFATSCNMIYMGTNSKAEDLTKPNYGSGNYILKLDDNSKVSVRERYLLPVGADDEAKKKATTEYPNKAKATIDGPANIAEAKKPATP